MASRYIFYGVLFGPLFKYIVVGGILGWFTSYLVYFSTQDESAAFIAGILVFLIFIGFFAHRTWKIDQKEAEHYARADARINEMANHVTIDKTQCMSCTEPLPEGTLICQNCGFDNNR